MSDAAPSRPRVLLGLVRLARFRADGLGQFGATPQHFLNSLAPLIALPLVGSLLMALRGQPRDGLSDFLAALVAVLVPPVLSQILAARWRREAGWLRYAVAFAWCQWLVPLALVLAMIVAQGFMGFGLGGDVAARAALFGAMAYVLALHWFLARAALGLGRGQAAVMTLATDFGTAAIIFLPLIVNARLHDG